MKYIFKKVIPLLLIIVVTTPIARGQKYHNQFAMNMLKDYSSYIYVSRLYGDSLTGIVICEPELGSRDVDLYANCYIESVVDNNGNTYNNENSSSYDISKPEGLWLPLGKGFFTSYGMMNSKQGVIIPTTVKSVKSVKIISNRTLAYDCNNCNYNQSVYTVKNDLKIRWTEIGYKTANHPAEYYFSNKRGVDEIVEGTPVNRYRGFTTTKEKPLLIHLLGAVGNNASGEVCFIFSIYGNGTDEKLAISQLTGFDEDGQAYRYEYDWTRPSYHQIGTKFDYFYTELSFKPFRVPVGTATLQKVKMSGKSDTYGYDEGSEYVFEWLNIPIQWVNPK